MYSDFHKQEEKDGTLHKKKNKKHIVRLHEKGLQWKNNKSGLYQFDLD